MGAMQGEAGLQKGEARQQDQLVLYEADGPVAIITLNDPERRNPLSTAMAEALIAALRRGCRDPQVRALVLTGAGQAFCAGGDIREFAGLDRLTGPQVLEQGERSTELFKAGQWLTKPLIGAVQGAAMGGGLGLVCLCHWVVAADDAVFATPEIQLGLFPLVILPLMMQVMGPRQALALGLSGRRIGAQEARALGLVTEVVARGQVLQRARAVATELAGRSGAAIGAGLRAYAAALSLPAPAAIDFANSLRVSTFLSADLKEGATAFLERRAPQWTHR